MQILLSTTGTLQTINIPELGGRTFEHPVVDFDLYNEFNIEEIRNSETIFSLLTDGHITLTDEYGRLVTPGSIKQLDDNQGLGEVLDNSNIANQSIDMGGFSIVQIQSMQFSGFNITGISGDTDILTIDKTLGDSMKLEYSIINSFGYTRTGTLMIVWDSVGSQFTDYSSEDLNGLTDTLEFTTSILGSNLLVTAIITTGNIWDVKYTYSIM